MPDAKTLFKQKFGYAPSRLVRAPGRLELIGNHTDYNEGLVMSIAVDKYVFFAAAPRTDGRVEIWSSAFPEPERFFAHDLRKNPDAPWANYIKGVLDQLRQRGIQIGGFNGAIDSTLPIGAGMSSSAALEVATALAVRELYPYALSPKGASPPQRDAQGHLPSPSAQENLELAKLCQAAENQFVGVNCGLLDQISSLFGKAFHAIEIDCLDLTVEPVPMLGEIAIVTCNSGVKHQLVGGEYNELRRLCEAAAHKLGVRSLRRVEPAQLKAGRDQLEPREYECAYHVVGEIQRVVAGARSLRQGDFEQFGQYMFQSHESSRDCFHNSTPELDLLVAIARAHPGCLGARLTGGGFGGATINLIRREQLDSFVATMSAQYATQSGHPLTPLLCQIADGASVMN